MENARDIWTRKEKSIYALNLLNKGDHILYVFDTETTGLNPKSDKVIQISIMKIKTEGKKLHVMDTLNEYIKQPVRFPSEMELSIRDRKFKTGELTRKDRTAFDVNRITMEKIENSKTEEELFPILQEFFNEDNRILCGYNVTFDINFLDRMFIRQSGTPFKRLKEDIIDVMDVAREIVPQETLIGLDPDDPTTGHYKQTCLASLFHIDTEGAHDSMVDIKMCTSVLMKLLNVYRNDYMKMDIPSYRSTLKVPVVDRIWRYKEGKNNLIMIQFHTTNDGNFESHRIYYDTRAKRYSSTKTEHIIPFVDMWKLSEDALKMAHGDFKNVK